MPIGRPTLYRPEMCERVLELSKQGASIEEIGLELDVCRDTIYEWKKVHPAFSDALKKGKFFNKGWWMREGRLSLRDKDFNPVLWYMNMKNRHGWADKADSNYSVSVEETKRQVRQKQKDLCKK